MKNHLNPRYKWLLVLQNTISWLITLVFLSVILLFSVSSIKDADAASTAVVMILIIPVIIFVPIFLITLWLSSWWYKNYTYELTDSVFKKEYGILTKRNTGIPYERIQNVDIVSPLVYRIFGLAQLNIQTAGGSSYTVAAGGAEGRLPGLSKEVALQLQADLLQRARLRNTSQSTHTDKTVVDGL